MSCSCHHCDDTGDRRFRNVIITGDPEIEAGVSIGDFSEVNAKNCRVFIGRGCDIASFVAINGADSSDRCLGLADEIHRGSVYIGERTFVGSHCFIGQNVSIGHHCKIAAGTILTSGYRIPPFSLVYGGAKPVVREGYYLHLHSRRTR